MPLGTLCLLCPVILSGQSVYAGQSAVAPQLTVDLVWEYQGLAPNMRLYSVDPARSARLWETRSVRRFSQIPVSTRIKGPLLLRKGSAVNFVLVYHNRSKKPVYFFAAPHRMTPAAFTLGFHFRCLCVNHVFAVPAGHYWYRVVRVAVSRHMAGDRLRVVHSLVAVDAERRRHFSGRRARPAPR